MSKKSVKQENLRDSSALRADDVFPTAAINFSPAPAVGGADAPIGLRLRTERENRGWSCEEVASRLKLQAGLIRRIEQDDYSGISHTVYLRGYLTSYARLLGLPLILAERVVAASGEHMPLVSTGTISRSRYLLDRYSVSATYLILTGLVIGPAVWLATHGGLEQNLARTVLLDAPAATLEIDAPKAAPSEVRNITMTSRVDAGPVQLDESVAAVSTPLIEPDAPPIVASMAPFSVVSEPVAAATVATPVGEHALTLKLSQASWVEVTAGNGEKLEYGLLAAGSERSYSGNGLMAVRVGNAQGAEIMVDGKTIDLAPFRRANVAHLKVSAEGVLASPAEP